MTHAATLTPGRIATPRISVRDPDATPDALVGRLCAVLAALGWSGDGVVVRDGAGAIVTGRVVGRAA